MAIQQQTTMPALSTATAGQRICTPVPKIISIYCIVGIGANQDNTIHREKHVAQFEMQPVGVKVSMTLKTLKRVHMLVPYSNIREIVLEE